MTDEISAHECIVLEFGVHIEEVGPKVDENIEDLNRQPTNSEHTQYGDEHFEHLCEIPVKTWRSLCYNFLIILAHKLVDAHWEMPNRITFTNFATHYEVGPKNVAFFPDLTRNFVYRGKVPTHGFNKQTT